MYCPYYGREIAVGQAYCLQCGASLPSSPTPILQTAPASTYAAPEQAKTVKFSYLIAVTAALTILLVFTAGLLAAQNAALQKQLSHPTLEMWNSCGNTPCSMNATDWRAGGVPDTFDYTVSFNSTVPVAIYFFTLDQYVHFASCNGKLSCVSGSFDRIGPSMVVSDQTFTLGEGCASYIAVYQSSEVGIIYPDVRVTYNPASKPTGVCI